MAGSAVPELDGCAYGLLAILVSNSGYSSEFLKWRQQVLKGDRVIQIKKNYLYSSMDSIIMFYLLDYVARFDYAPSPHPRTPNNWKEIIGLHEARPHQS